MAYSVPVVIKNIFNKTKFLFVATALLVSNLMVLAPLTTQKAFAASSTVCSTGCSYTTISDAIAASSNGDAIQITENTTITNTVIIDKSLTITGTPGVAIQTSGDNSVFVVTAAGASITNLAFNKTDNTGVQNIIGIQANNVIVSNNVFTGQYVIGDGAVSRAVVVSGVTNFDISNNSFTSLRQPVYSDGSGSFSNNFTAGTKGFVASSNTNITFSGNTWGTGANRNVIDLAIIPTATNNYPDNVIVQISANNNDAVVENQFGGTPVLSDVFIDSAAAPGGNGLPRTAYNTLTPLVMTRVATGGTVKIANGTYPLVSQILVTKQVHFIGAGASTITTNGSLQLFTITGNGSSIQNLVFIKTDVAFQELIGVQANDVLLANNNFSGQYDLGDPDVSRALAISTSTGVQITGNSFDRLRQPAYINDFTTGTISNNYLNASRGWVVVGNSSMNFTGNTWGINAFDIAFIPGLPDSYTCPVLDTIRAINSNANIINQNHVAPCVPTHLTPADGSVRTTANQTLIDWTDETDSSGTVTYRYQSSNSTATNADGSFSTPAYTSGTLTTSEISTVGTPEGTYYWHVKAIDNLGNESSWSAYWKIIVDNTPPAVSFGAITNPIVGGSVTPDTTATDPNGPLTFSWVAVISANQSLISNATVAEPTFSPSVDGSYEFDLTVTDTAGNNTTKRFSFVWKAPVAANQPANIVTPAFVVLAPAPAASNPGLNNFFFATANNEQVPETTATNAVLSSKDKTADEADGNVSAPIGSIRVGKSSWLWWLIGIAAFVVTFLYFFSRRRSSSNY